MMRGPEISPEDAARIEQASAGWADRVAEIVANAPPLSPSQAESLRRILTGTGAWEHAHKERAAS